MYNLPNRVKVAEKIKKKTERLELKNSLRKQKGKNPKVYKPTIGEWMMNVIGEPPSILENTLTKKSSKQISLYLKQKGFFNNKVTDSTAYKKNKKAEVYYQIKALEPYKIRKTNFSISDTGLFNVIMNSTSNTLLKPGKIYDTQLFQDERLRITNNMKNHGYFDFTKEYIYFKIDSSLNKNRVDINLIIKNPVVNEYINGEDSIIEKRHLKYTINNVIISSNYKEGDTPSNFFEIKNEIVHESNHERFKSNVINKQIFVKPGESYSVKHTEITKNKLSGLQTFRLINIQYEKINLDDDKNYLNCRINLTPSSRQSLTFEGKGTNRSGNLGIAGNIIYKNKNTFKGAEILELRLKTGLESQQLTTTENNESINENLNGFFNTIEYGPELSLHIPGLLIPFHMKTEKYNRSTTTLSSSFNHQNRPDYKRDVLNSSFGYSWNSSKYTSHIFRPMELSLVKIDKSDDFNQRLIDSENSLLINSYNDHLISASKYSFTYSNRSSNKMKNFVFFRSNTETAGNLLRSVSGVLGLEKDENDSYSIFNINYAQYIKQDFDFRIYNVLNKKSNVVYRIYAGAGIALENLNVLPFEKSFFGGGANGIRGWAARTLGPGGLSPIDTTSVRIDQIGDLQIEFNVEYRFDIYKSFKGAAFVDAGNIWLIDEDPLRPNGKFEVKEFYNQIAVSAGLGARFDFNFFIIRLDAAVKIKDPGLEKGERWIFEPKSNTNALRNIAYGDNYSPYSYSPILNIGIGYPF